MNKKMVNQNKSRNIKKVSLRQRRTFSIEIKRQTVKDIENGICSVLEACRELGCSDVCIYKWLDKYSRYLKTNKQLVVQDKSEAYRSIELANRVKELEAQVGRQYMESALLEKIIELAGAEYGVDLKKTFSNHPLSGSASTKGSSTGSK